MANWNDLFGGGGLIMPSWTTNQDSGVTLKDGVITGNFANGAAFWASIDVSHTDKGYESVSLSCAADTTEQTIVDVTASGVLTHVMSPAPSAAGIITIRATIDGVVKTFISETLSGANASRYMIGHFIGAGAEATAANGAGISSGNDSGYSSSGDSIMLTTPIQALNIGKVGLVFNTSLKVTVQSSVNVTATAEMLKALACYSLSIPAGL